MAIQKQLLGNEPLEVAHSLRDLGIVLSQNQKQAEAESVEREALSLRRTLLEGDHTDIADSLNRLAGVLTDDGPWIVDPMHRYTTILSKQGKRDELQKVFEEIPIPSAGRVRYRIALMLCSAELLRERGRLVESEQLYRQAVDLSTTELGDEDPLAIASLASLNVLLRQVAESADTAELGEPSEPPSVSPNPDPCR